MLLDIKTVYLLKNIATVAYAKYYEKNKQLKWNKLFATLLVIICSIRRHCYYCYNNIIIYHFTTYSPLPPPSALNY